MLESYIDLLHRQRYGALATFSEALPGFPFASVIPYAPDDRHGPVFFVSGLAEHTRNLLQNPKASLLLFDTGEPDVLAAPRATIVGTVEPVLRDDSLERHYLRYQPAAGRYLGLPDFRFFRLRPERVRWVAGFGRMGWLAGSEIEALGEPPDTLTEAAILAAQPKAPAGIRLLGMDRLGIDYERNGQRARETFDSAANSPDDMAAGLHHWLASLR